MRFVTPGRRRILPALLACAALVAVCGCSGTSPQVVNPADNPYNQTIPELQVGCNWVRAFNVSGGYNYAFPDLAANYWIALPPTNPVAGSSLRIDGLYPSVRYFSIHVYDGLAQLVQELPDYEYVPTVAGTNRFLGPSQIDQAILPLGAYTANIDFASAPATEAANTFYVGTLGAPGGPTTLADRRYIMYRTYISAAGAADPTGGAGLPALTLETPSGAIPLAGNTTDTAACEQLYASASGSSSSSGGAGSITGGEGAGPGTPTAQATNPPTFRVFYGVPGFGQGIFRNTNVAYMSAITAQTVADAYIIRGQAPTWATEANAPQEAQLRYWSLCQNEPTSQSVVACVADYQAVLDSGGYYNIVVAASGNQPSDATEANGFNFMAFGSETEGDVIFRNMLPDANYSEAIQNVPELTAPSAVMGNYLPQIVYCSRAKIE